MYYNITISGSCIPVEFIILSAYDSRTSIIHFCLLYMAMSGLSALCLLISNLRTASVSTCYWNEEVTKWHHYDYLFTKRNLNWFCLAGSHATATERYQFGIRDLWRRKLWRTLPLDFPYATTIHKPDRQTVAYLQVYQSYLFSLNEIMKARNYNGPCCFDVLKLNSGQSTKKSNMHLTPHQRKCE